MIRKAAVSGSFYPAQCSGVEAMIEQFDSILVEALKTDSLLELSPRAVIVPHAGYIYSGFTANVAHRLLANSDPATVVVVGPSHRVYFRGVSGSFYDFYETPCGEIPIDRKLLAHLAEIFEISFEPSAHNEHSTEVQMPFIHHYLPDAKVAELVYSDTDPLYLSKIFEAVLSHKDYVLVISTDLSHYYDLKKAQTLDAVCLKAVNDLDEGILNSGCEACGKTGVEAMILTAKKLNLTPKILDYRTSADASGDESAVVGYMSAAFLAQ